MAGARKTPEVIDLFKMTDEQSAFVAAHLCDVFATNRDLNFHSKHHVFFDTSNQPYCLSHDLVRVPKSSHFILFDFNKESCLGKGSFGSVYKSSGELFFKNLSVQVRKNEKYAIKLSKHDVMLINEFVNTEQIKYLQMKNIGIVEFEIDKIKKAYGGALMKRVPGQSLRDFLDEDNKIKLSTEERIDLSLKLLYQLKEQIHQQGLVHLDVKPGNILISKKDNRPYPYSVRHIDLGLSKKKDEYLQKIIGTLGYIAPETFSQKEQRKASLAKDAYAMGVTLAEVWGHKITKQEHSAIKKNLHLRRSFSLRNLDEDYSISDKPKKMIHKAIVKLTKLQEANRISIDKAIQVFHKAKREIVLAKIPNAFHKSVEKSSHLAQQVRNTIRVKPCSIKTLKYHLEEAINKIDDNEYALAEFQYVTNIKVFLGLKTKNEFLNKINLIHDGFNKIDKLIDLADELVADKNASTVVDRISKNNNRIKSSVAKLDNMQKMNMKNQKLIQSNLILLKLKRLSEISASFRALLSLQQSNEPLSLKQSIAKAITGYIDKTLTKRNVSKNDRAFSDRRICDMQHILMILNSDIDDSQLAKSLKISFKSPEFTTGFFGRSCLREEVLKAIKTHENSLDASATARSRSRL